MTCLAWKTKWTYGHIKGVWSTLLEITTLLSKCQQVSANFANVVSKLSIHANSLPTYCLRLDKGSGKTFVAAEFILRGLNRIRKSQKEDRNRIAALFLVPTCDLVTQQKRALEHWIGKGYDVVHYFGGQATPMARFDVLVSTPQAFLVCNKHHRIICQDTT